MTSNQDNKQKDLPILMTGVDVMNDLSIDARMVISLAYEGLLIPYIPAGATQEHFKFCMNSTYELPEKRLSAWMYRKCDVEEFKLKYKGWLEGSRKQKTDSPSAESQKQSPTESENFVSVGNKGVEQAKKKRSRSSDDRALAITLANLHIDQHKAKKKIYTLHEAATTIQPHLKKKNLLVRTIKGWIASYFPDEAKRPGRPKKKK